MKQYLKFTFDVEEVLKKTDIYYNFSEIHMCDFDKSYCIMQSNVYKEVLKLCKDNKEKDIVKKAYERGFCTPCAIHNAFPFVFNEDIKNVAKSIYNNLARDKFANVKYMVNYLNDLNHGELLHCSEKLNDSYKVFLRNIQKNQPIVVTYQYANVIPKYMKKQHTISLFGYDDNSIYYFENSDFDILFISLLCYIRDYLTNFPKSLDIKHNELLDKFLSSNNNETIKKLGKEIVGYKRLDNGLTMLNKNFLTNEKIFFDINQLVECIDYEKYRNYSEFIPVQTMDSMNFSDLGNLTISNKVLKEYIDR